MFREDQGFYKYDLLWVGTIFFKWLIREYIMYVTERNINLLSSAIWSVNDK